MAQVYGIIGSLACLLDEFNRHDVTFLNSVDDIQSFNHNYENLLSNIREQAKLDIAKEKNDLEQKLVKFTSEYDMKIKNRYDLLTEEKKTIDSHIDQYSVKSNDIFVRLYNFYKRHSLINRKNLLLSEFDEEVKRPFYNLNRNILNTKESIDYINNYFDTILENKAKYNSRHLYSAKTIIYENNLFLLGAIGEQKALEELKKLPDSFTIINDFKYDFWKALHKKDTDDWIKSIQSDHLLIGPPGVFVIETKNWSNNSIQNLDLYSPVQQVQRTSYAVYMLLNQIVANGTSSLNRNWGPRQIPVKNIILMINKKPDQEFQHVKILTLNTLCQYVKYQKPIFSTEEVQEIANILLNN